MAVTSTNNLRKGSTGSDVVELQKKLNNNGYKLDTDGIFGDKTLAAVQDYQKKNGLTVDGIVGTNTWGALNKASSGTTAQTPAQTQTTAPTFNYTKSDAVAQAEALLQEHLSGKPGAYQGGTWADQLNEVINQINNREKFSYDLNGDMLYQQYKDQYNTQGKLASMDVMGQAAAMSGGYGNSYAQTAGQQAYQGYLQQLNDRVPELYQLALNQYNQEGQDLYNKASLMAQMDEQEYGRYRDTVSDYYTELANLKDDARYMSDTEYERAWNDFSAKYGAYRDTVSDQQWQTSFDYQKEQDQIANDMALKQLNASLNSGSKDPKYATFDYAAQTEWKADWEEAVNTGDLGALEDIADRMVQAGIDPSTAAAWYDSYAAKVVKKDAPEEKPVNNPYQFGGINYTKW